MVRGRARAILLGVGTVAVIASLVVLYVIATTEDGTVPSAAPAVAEQGSAAQFEPATSPGLERPQVPAPIQDQEPAAPRDYVIDGTRIRDYRKKGAPPPDLPRVHLPETARHLPSTLTHALNQQLLPVMKGCVAAVPRGDPGISAQDKPKVEGAVYVQIKEHQLKIMEATFHLRHVSGAEAEAATRCLEEKSFGISTPAPEEADLDRYTIRVSFTL